MTTVTNIGSATASTRTLLCVKARFMPQWVVQPHMPRLAGRVVSIM